MLTSTLFTWRLVWCHERVIINKNVQKTQVGIWALFRWKSYPWVQTSLLLTDKSEPWKQRGEIKQLKETLNNKTPYFLKKKEKKKLEKKKIKAAGFPPQYPSEYINKVSTSDKSKKKNYWKYINGDGVNYFIITSACMQFKYISNSEIKFTNKPSSSPWWNQYEWSTNKTSMCSILCSFICT